MRTRDSDGQEFQRISVDLPVTLLRDIDTLAEQDSRKRADWVRVEIAAAVRARKAKRATRG